MVAYRAVIVADGVHELNGGGALVNADARIALREVAGVNENYLGALGFKCVP